MSVVPTRRRGRPGHDLSTVLAGAVDVFNERGFDGTSMEDLAQRLAISKSSIYHHVESKDALLGLALDRGLVRLEAAIADARRLDAPALLRLESLVRSSVVVLLDDLPYVTLLLRVRGNSAVEQQALARRRRIDRQAGELVKQAIGDGDLRPDLDPVVTSRLIFGTVNSLIDWVKPRTGRDAAALADSVVAMTFDGLRAR